MYKYSNLIVPTGIWSGTPKHKITCVTFLGDNKLATGSATGLICLWSITENDIIPTIILSGHKTLVSALVYDEFDQNPSLVSGMQYLSFSKPSHSTQN
jgi:WD40 repeat protein